VAEQQRFLADELMPRLDAVQAGQGHVFFVDAAHFVFGTFLCCLWSFGRLFVRAASGRQRFNVLGAWNAVTRELIAVTNTTVVNTETMCELLREVAARELTGPITFVLDNARYQRNATVQARPCKKSCVSPQKWVSLATRFLERRLMHGCFITITGRAVRG
jgi:hypothetical protein